MPWLPRLEWRGTLGYSTSRVVSYLKARCMVEKGCLAYWAYICNYSVEVPFMDSILVASFLRCEFPTDFPGIAPNRDINFCIGLVSGTQLISIPPYHMAAAELEELKDQLQDLLDKGFIRLGVSPWDVPVLFAKKKE
ncbi:uncharacterized protein [Nicotiana tomentosiformis]|uniref:uncharacterized protein n=1 Tax=Nicotiana tomentosiformis TaxID=4098 RepID=UPI00388C71F8